MAGRERQRDQDHLGALAAYPKHAVAVFFAEVGDVHGCGLEDPQAEQAEHRGCSRSPVKLTVPHPARHP